MPEEKVSLSPSSPPPVPQPADAVPTDLVPLPSEGLVYPPGHPLHGAQSVEIRSMTARDEDILTSRALLKGGRAIPMLLRSCVVDRRIDVDGLLSGDRNAILVGIRITGYGPEYSTAITCPGCGEEVRRTVDLREMPIKRFPAGTAPLRPGANEFEFALPRLGKRVTFKLMTGEDERELLLYAQNSRKTSVVEELVTTRHRLMIQSLGGETDRARLAQLIADMPASDSRAFRKHVDALTPGVDLRVAFECPSCGHEAKEVEVPLGAEFFWPRA